MTFSFSLSLSDELHPLVCEVIDKTDIGKDCFLTLDPARPKSRLRCYDIQAAALIIVTMKLLFRLNDQHEWWVSVITEMKEQNYYFFCNFKVKNKYTIRSYINGLSRVCGSPSLQSKGTETSVHPRADTTGDNLTSPVLQYLFKTMNLWYLLECDIWELTIILVRKALFRYLPARCSELFSPFSKLICFLCVRLRIPGYGICFE